MHVCTWQPDPVGIRPAADDVARAHLAGSRRGGTLVGGPVAASWWQGAAGKHQWNPGVVPGKEEGAGAQQRGGSTMREKESGGSSMF
jgi:hypothetical protein